MPDTVRSTDDLLNASTGLFRDNTSGDISAQDLRDFALSAYRPQGFAGGRLTTESGVPVSTSDRTAQSTLYYTPYAHDLIGLYDGTSWKLHPFSERSLALSGLTSGKNYDVFLYDNAGTLTLELSAAWTTDTTRADALATQDGVYVKSGATSRRYLGTIRTTGTTTTEDSGYLTSSGTPKRFVWNAYNRVARGVRRVDTTDTWSYSSSTYRQTNNSAANQIEVVCGLSGLSHLRLVNASSSGSSQMRIAIGQDSTTTPLAVTNFYADGTTGASGMVCWNNLNPTLGYHYYAMLENSASGSTTFYGDVGIATTFQTGMTGTWEC